MWKFLFVAGCIAGCVAHVIILWAAFKRSVLTGLLTFFVPLYIFYFVFAQYESEHKGKVITLWLSGIALGIIGIIIAAPAAGTAVR